MSTKRVAAEAAAELINTAAADYVEPAMPAAAMT